MANLVGDLICSARELAVDFASTLPAPSVSGAAAAAGTLTNTTWYFKATALNSFGETVGSSELNATGTGFSFTLGSVVGAVSYRVYFGTTSGGQTQYVTASPGSVSVTALTNAVAGTPPTRSSAYLPDTDGTLVSAATLYRWLNEAIDIAAQITGGIPDTTGLSTSTNLPIYAVTGQWKKFTNAWFDGWPVNLGGKGDTFQKTRITGIVANIVPFKQNDVQYLECWPIPNRTAVSTTLTSGVNASVTTIPVAALPQLDHGLIKVDNEIIYYGAISGLSLIGCIRGMGGTVPATHLNAAAVSELNIRLDGYRMPEKYTVGSSLNTLTMPPAWPTLLTNFILSKFKAAEQDMQASQQLRQMFEQEMGAWARTNRPLAGPWQIGNRSGVESVPGLGGLGGGIIRL